jgi:hypothetical protein
MRERSSNITSSVIPRREGPTTKPFQVEPLKKARVEKIID